MNKFIAKLRIYYWLAILAWRQERGDMFIFEGAPRLVIVTIARNWKWKGKLEVNDDNKEAYEIFMNLRMRAKQEWRLNRRRAKFFAN